MKLGWNGKKSSNLVCERFAKFDTENKKRTENRKMNENFRIKFENRNKGNEIINCMAF